MEDLKGEINTLCNRFQAQFNGVFALKKEHRDEALSTFLKANIFQIPHKPKWALFPLYVIYQLLYRYSSGLSEEEDISYAYQLVTLQLYHAMQDLNGPANIDLHMAHSFILGTLKNGRPDNIDEYSDLKRKGILNTIQIGPQTITFEKFLSDIIGPGPLKDLPYGGKSRRRRQHRRFRSKKRGRKSLRKRRN
jgi:hypothetical protein